MVLNASQSVSHPTVSPSNFHQSSILTPLLSFLGGKESSLFFGAKDSGDFVDDVVGSQSGSWLNRKVMGTILCVIVGLLVTEQAIYRYKKSNLPGSTWTIPIMGKFMDSMNPSLEGYKKQWASGALSCVSVFHYFIVIASSNEYARKILNSPTYAEPCLTSAAKPILLKENWVFLHGKVHADYRKALNVLFTKKALSIYLPIQERIYRKYFQRWMSDPSPSRKYMMEMRDLNMETSLRVFLGNYLTDEAAEEISTKYWDITTALQLVNFPLALPGTKIWKAIQARKVAMKHLEAASAACKIRMAQDGAEPECLLDAWIAEMTSARNRDGEDEQKRVLSREYSDHEIAMVVLSFLFASQDAMTSAIVWLFQLTIDNPEVLAKIREEQYRVRNGDVTAPTSLEMVDQMVYTRAVVKEVLRLMPPVIMVPYMAKKPFKLSDDYTAPAGTMVIPSFWGSLHDEHVYPEPDKFIPERWLPTPEGDLPLAEKSPQNYLVFGSGPHKCIGIHYASMHLAAVIGSASVLMDWEHHRTPQSDDVNVICTIFPKDEMLLKFTPRPVPTEA